MKCYTKYHRTKDFLKDTTTDYTAWAPDKALLLQQEIPLPFSPQSQLCGQSSW